MNIDELIQYDASFSIPGFIATADNTYMMLQTAVMLGNLSRIKSKVSDNLFQKIQSIVDDFNNNGLRQMYDDLAVKKTDSGLRPNCSFLRWRVSCCYLLFCCRLILVCRREVS